MKETLTKIISFLFNITLTLFLVLGAVIVLVQLASVVLTNGDLAVGVSSLLGIWAIRISCVTAFCGFFLSYLRPKKKKEA